MDFDQERTVTLTEHEWLSISTALRAHAMTQDALGFPGTAKRARGLATLVEPTQEVSDVPA